MMRFSSFFHLPAIVALSGLAVSAPALAAHKDQPKSHTPRPAPQDKSHGQVIHLFWKNEEIYDHNRQTVTLTGGARAQRGNVTVDADTLIGYLRPKSKAPAHTKTTTNKKTTPQENTTSSSSSDDLELYRVEAIGHVHVYNQEDQGWGDHGLYDIDKAVMVMTGQHMKFTTPHQLMTARDLVEYYPDAHISLGWGDASVTTSDGKRITADVMQAFELTDAQKAANKASTSNQPNGDQTQQNNSLDRAFGWGHVIIRTQSQTAIGDRGVYLAGPQLARLIGNVHVTQGQNQNNGAQAIVNLKTGISHMLAGSTSPIQGLIVPNEATP